MKPPKSELEAVWDKYPHHGPIGSMEANRNSAVHEALEAGLKLVESSFAHVSHGGPTRADAEAWIKQAKSALDKPSADAAKPAEGK